MRVYLKGTRPKLKTRGLSVLHIVIFKEIIYSGITNWEINRKFGYTKKSYAVVAHSRKVMTKLLILEHLHREHFQDQLIYPRKYPEFWRTLFNKHQQVLYETAIIPRFYDSASMPQIDLMRM